MWIFFFFSFQSGQQGENGGVWYEENRSVTLSLSAVASYFPLHFSARCPLLILALSPEPTSASHLLSLILALAVPSILTFSLEAGQTDKSRSHHPLLFSLWFTFLPPPHSSHSFISCLSHFPTPLSCTACVCTEGWLSCREAG